MTVAVNPSILARLFYVYGREFDMRLQDRVALITGAGRGIGRAIALAYAREGAKLALAARTRNELEETAELVQRMGAEADIISVDVTNPAQVEAMARQAQERFSTIDILVNNAGVGGPVGPLQDNDIASWVQTIEVNIIGLYYCCRAVLPTMLAQNRGKIINMSGVGGRHVSAYGASKVAVVELTETLALELADTNIQVNSLSPGSIHTRMWEETRDAAQAIGDEELYDYGVQVTSGDGAALERAVEFTVFLASDASGHLSGRLLRAVADDLATLAGQVPEIMASDQYTLRRVEG